MNPLVSVIVPVFNVEKYIVKCVDSIRNQTYKNIEIILIDDGSTDKSGQICDDYSKIDRRIVVFHNVNTGVSYSRNYGMNLSKGKYLLFVDADDSVELSYVDKMVSAMECGEEIDLVICRYKDVYDNYTKEIKIQKERLNGNYADDLIELYALSCGPIVKLYNSEIIKKESIQFPVNISFSEDRIFNYEYTKHIRKYKFLDEALYSYWHRNVFSLSKSRTYKSYCDAIKVLILEKEFLKFIKAKDKNIMLTNSAIDYLNYFSKLENKKYNTYTAFTKRVNEISDVLGEYCFHNKIKRKIIAFCLKYRIIFPLYIYYNYLKRL